MGIDRTAFLPRRFDRDPFGARLGNGTSASTYAKVITLVVFMDQSVKPISEMPRHDVIIPVYHCQLPTRQRNIHGVRLENGPCNLRPGAYVFEGKRPGYRSRLVEVTVQAGGGVPVEVWIVCDERS